jgi:cob(I)alamin adenosyltransferase
VKIYTKTGDDGTTSLFSGGRVPKHHLRVESYGTVDELNSVLGLARAQQPSQATDADLGKIQHQLFNLGADLATPLDAPTRHIVRMDADTVTWLEQSIDRMICRRAERLVTQLQEAEPVGEHVLPYLNRLSDYLFTLARWENGQAGISEEKWSIKW